MHKTFKIMGRVALGCILFLGLACSLIVWPIGLALFSGLFGYVMGTRAEQNKRKINIALDGNSDVNHELQIPVVG